MAHRVGGGWPPVLSGLETLLETRETLPLNQEPPSAVRRPAEAEGEAEQK
jgi:hypothetical protein